MKTQCAERGDIIERSINVEWLINCILSQHYVGRVSSRFLLEFLYDESCSFGLKINVLMKAFPSLKDEIDCDLRKLNR